MKTFIFTFLLATAFGAPSNDVKSPRIMGGSYVAAAGEIPYIVSFQEVMYYPPYHFCGGVIYDAKFIITTSSCLEHLYLDHPERYQITAGEVNLAQYVPTQQSINAKRFILHENFTGPYLVNDIGLIELVEPLVFNEYVSPVKLAEKGQESSGMAVVSGWGFTEQMGGQISDNLKEVEIPIVTDAMCRKEYNDDIIFDSMLCAGSEGKDACGGDAGGPLMCGDHLCGVVSWGYGCGNQGYPGIYTEISYYVDWIREHAVLEV